MKIDKEFTATTNYNIPAEVKDLAIIPDEPDTLARVDTGPTEVASLDAHGYDLQEIFKSENKFIVCIIKLVLSAVLRQQK